MSGMINNLGTRLFKSVTDKAGDLGDKFEVEFSRLSYNITGSEPDYYYNETTAEVDAIVSEAISLSSYIKVALVILCVLLVLAIIRLSAFGLRCLFFKARDWLRANEARPPPQVILLMPTEDGQYKKTSNMYSDSQTKSIIDKLRQNSFELFNDSEGTKVYRPKNKAPMLASLKEAHNDIV